MVELIKKENLTKEELEKLDFYFSDNIELLLVLDNSIIIRFIELCEEILGYSLTKKELSFYLSNESISMSHVFVESWLDGYKKRFELMQHFNIEDYELGYSIADYYLKNNDKESALYYYGNTFKEGFNLCHENYYDALVRYLELLNKNPSEELIKLIKSSYKDKKYSLDFINSYLLLIINLEKFSDEYLKYINEGIKVAKVVVRDYQQYTQSRTAVSNSAEERNLCELITLKMEYYAHKKEYIKAFEMYKELTKEIGLSDCTRYYHARDLYYRQMLECMSEEYPELKFFEDIGYATFKVLGDIKDLSSYLNKEIELEKENGLTFKFKVTNIYENCEFTIAPLLPLIGEGGHIFTTLIKENDTLYLKNILSH